MTVYYRDLSGGHHHVIQVTSYVLINCINLVVKKKGEGWGA